MNKLFYFVFIFVFSMFVLLPNKVHAQERPETYEGQITKIVDTKEITENEFEYVIQTLEVKVTKGVLVGSTIALENNTVSINNPVLYEEGDKVVLMHTVDWEGNDMFVITDFVRRDGLVWLFVLFVILAIGIGGIWGMTSLIGMGISFLIIFQFILPRIIEGGNPIVIAIMGSAFIIPATFYLSHGMNKKTNIAVVGTLVSLIATGLLAVYFVDLTRLTGFASEEASFLSFQQDGTLNMKGLLLAGIIIGTLGILDDITISQASIVQELVLANERIKRKDLFVRAMRVGRDHIASLINTLVLVYTGASLPLLLLFIGNPSPFTEVVNIELIADEIVRTLVGSIGLILAVPITTFFAVIVLKKD